MENENYGNFGKWKLLKLWKMEIFKMEIVEIVENGNCENH